MIQHIGIAVSSFAAPLASARSLRLSFVAGVAFVAFVIGCYAAGWLDDRQVESLRELAIVPGMPIMAAVVAEMALRDGITHRTLLYPLLGPVPRPTLAIVRTACSGLVLATGAAAVVIVLHFVGDVDLADLPRELMAIFLGGLTFTAMYGVVHMIWRRGLITALVLFGLDFTVARLPFSIRTSAPTYHLSVVADIENTFPMPISMDLPDPSFLGSCFFLVVAMVVAGAIVALLFSRKNLGELC